MSLFCVLSVEKVIHHIVKLAKEDAAVCRKFETVNSSQLTDMFIVVTLTALKRRAQKKNC